MRTADPNNTRRDRLWEPVARIGRLQSSECRVCCDGVAGNVSSRGVSVGGHKGVSDCHDFKEIFKE